MAKKKSINISEQDVRDVFSLWQKIKAKKWYFIVPVLVIYGLLLAFDITLPAWLDIVKIAESFFKMLGI